MKLSKLVELRVLLRDACHDRRLRDYHLGFDSLPAPGSFLWSYNIFRDWLANLLVPWPSSHWTARILWFRLDGTPGRKRLWIGLIRTPGTVDSLLIRLLQLFRRLDQGKIWLCLIEILTTPNCFDIGSLLPLLASRDQPCGAGREPEVQNALRLVHELLALRRCRRQVA
jgi:hypothetical protein